MQTLNLIQKQGRHIRTGYWIFLVFLLVLAGIFLMYRYLFSAVDVISHSVARTVAKDFYLEATDVSCRNNNACADKCADGKQLGTGESCLCLKDLCYLVTESENFSQAKFCESDAECTSSCYEGPVSKTYYAQVGGAKNDCAEGCKNASIIMENGAPSPIVCGNRQCQYRNSATCFVSVTPKRTQ